MTVSKFLEFIEGRDDDVKLYIQVQETTGIWPVRCVRVIRHDNESVAIVLGHDCASTNGPSKVEGAK